MKVERWFLGAMVATLAGLMLTPSALAAGAPWTLVPVNGTTTTPTTNLRAISMLSPSLGFAVGGPSPTVGSAYSFNGTSWNPLGSLPSGTPFLYGVTAVDASHVWAAGNCNALLYWDGTKWTGQTTPTSPCLASSPTLRGISVVHPGPGLYLGVAVGTGGNVLFSANATVGGWTTRTSNTPNKLLDVQLRSDGRGWAVGVAGTILTTTDFGKTWSAPVANPASADPAAQLTGVDFISDTDGWAVGYSASASGVRSYILHWDSTTSAWVDQTPAGLGEPLFAVSFVDANQGWIPAVNASSQGVVLSTTDGSAAAPTFASTVVASTPGDVLFDLEFTDACNGDTVGAQNTAARYKCATPPPTPTPTPTPPPSPTPGIGGHLGHPGPVPFAPLGQLLGLAALAAVAVGARLATRKAA